MSRRPTSNSPWQSHSFSPSLQPCLLHCGDVSMVCFCMWCLGSIPSISGDQQTSPFADTKATTTGYQPLWSSPSSWLHLRHQGCWEILVAKAFQNPEEVWLAHVTSWSCNVSFSDRLQALRGSDHTCGWSVLCWRGQSLWEHPQLNMMKDLKIQRHEFRFCGKNIKQMDDFTIQLGQLASITCRFPKTAVRWSMPLWLRKGSATSELSSVRWDGSPGRHGLIWWWMWALLRRAWVHQRSKMCSTSTRPLRCWKSQLMPPGALCSQLNSSWRMLWFVFLLIAVLQT